MPKKYVEGIGSEEFLIDNLLIKNHILTVIGESGAGKTAFFFFHGAKHMAKRGANVYYDLMRTSVDSGFPEVEFENLA